MAYKKYSVCEYVKIVNVNILYIIIPIDYSFL